MSPAQRDAKIDAWQRREDERASRKTGAEAIKARYARLTEDQAQPEDTEAAMLTRGNGSIAHRQTEELF